jgi:hypothetical protein
MINFDNYEIERINYDEFIKWINNKFYGKLHKDFKLFLIFLDMEKVYDDFVTIFKKNHFISGFNVNPFGFVNTFRWYPNTKKWDKIDKRWRDYYGKVINESINFNDYEEERKLKKKVIIFASGDYIYFGKIVKIKDNYRILISINKLFNDSYPLDILNYISDQRSYNIYSPKNKFHNMDKLLKWLTINNYDIILIDSYLKLMDIKRNSRNYI